MADELLKVLGLRGIIEKERTQFIGITGELVLDSNQTKVTTLVDLV